MSNFSDEFSLDAILNEVKSFSFDEPVAPVGKSSAPTERSMDDIDRLIAQTAASPAVEEKPTEHVPQHAKPEPVTVREPVRFAADNIPVSEFFSPVKKPDEPAPQHAKEEINPADRIAPPDEIDEIIASLLADRRNGVKLEQVKEPEPEPVSEPEPAPTHKKTRIIESFVINAEGPIDTSFAKNEPEDIKLASEKKQPDIQVISAADEKIPDFDPLAAYEKSREDKTTVMPTDINRESFLHPMKLAPEKEEPEETEGPVERPGIVLEKSDDATKVIGLEPLPTVMSADLARTQVVGHTEEKPPETKPVEPAQEDEEFPGQIKLSGFEDVPDEVTPDKAEEKEIETRLIENRRRRAKDFHIVPEEGSELEEEAYKEAAASPEERRKIHKQQKKEQEKSRRQAQASRFEYRDRGARKAVHAALSAKIASLDRYIFCGIADIAALLFVSVIPKLLEAGSIESGLFSAGSPGIYVANAILLIFAIAVESDAFTGGFKSLLNRRPNARTAAAITAAVVFAHTTVTAVCQSDKHGITPMFSIIAVLGFLAVNIADKLNCRRTLLAFETCAYKYDGEVYTVHSFEDEREVAELSRSLMLDSAELLYSSKARFPGDIVRNSRNTRIERTAVNIILPIALVAAVVTSVLAFVMGRDRLEAFTVFTAAVCLCSPVLASLVPAAATYAVNRNLQTEGTVVAGLNQAEKVSGANAVVIDAADVFDRSACKMVGMIDSKKIRVDELLVYAAAMVIKSGGPLRDAFEKVVSRDHNLLPTVSDLVYEQKMGISARIHGQKCLLGNRTLLLNHDVDVPEGFDESKYNRDGQKTLYLAVKGVLVSIFVVTYKVDENLTPFLSALETNGTQILIRTNDVNVTEELLSAGFNLPRSAFTVLGPVAGRLYKHRRDEVTDYATVRIAHNGNAYTMLHGITAAQRLVANEKFYLALQILASVFGFVAAAFLVGVSLTRFITGLTTVLFTLIASVIGVWTAVRLNKE